MKNFLRRLYKDEAGVIYIEYALIALLIAVFLVAAITLLQAQIVAAFAAITAALAAAIG
jgi:Flp pilus assembly pilin Flp